MKHVAISLKLLLLSNLGSVSSFAVNSNYGGIRNNNPNRYQQRLLLSVLNSVSLDLKGDIDVTSNPLPSLSDDQMATLFAIPEYRNILLTAGGKRSCEELTLTDDLLEEWKTACDVVGAEHPNENDSALAVTTGGIDFPGLHLVSTAKIGVKLIQEPSPRLQSVLIGDEQTVKGLPPVVWIFNKLTGRDSSDGGKKGDNTSTSSLTITSYDRTDDGKKTTITAKSTISISVKFPAVLLKILPTSKEKAEETGGKSLCKTIEKDVIASITSFEEAYMKFLEEEEESAGSNN